ncbi:MAG TPA: rod shape-determining protein MreC [Candidatus Saccharimonadia bacterium]|nr:rod shape-determining protein MreC [Candidatus Saccharimonadia bacterium]
MAIGAVLVTAGVLGRLGPARWLYDHTLTPIGSTFTAMGTNTAAVVSNLSQIRNLASQNAQLQNENAQLRQRLAADDQTRRDNDLLRKELGLDVAGAPREVATEVVAFQPDSYRQFVTINKGSKAGIQTGMAVLSQGVLIGTINSTQATTSQVMLVTDPEFKLTAEDQNTGATGVINGLLGSGLLLNEIGQTDTVKPGDTVTTSGLGGSVPAGLLIGQIESVDTTSNVVFQQADVETTFQLNQLRFAFVVLGP